MSKIEQIIDEMENYIESCKYQALSTTKIVVVKDEMEELIQELRLKTPEEIKKYQKIITNRDAILNDAKERAEGMIAEATAHITELVSEHEIMQQAYKQANDVVQQANTQAQQILDSATNDANNIRLGAVSYADETLANLQGILTNGMSNFQDRYDSLMRALNTSLEVVVNNRNELTGQQTSSESEEFDDEMDDEDTEVEE